MDSITMAAFSDELEKIAVSDKTKNRLMLAAGMASAGIGGAALGRHLFRRKLVRGIAAVTGNKPANEATRKVFQDAEKLNIRDLVKRVV